MTPTTKAGPDPLADAHEPPEGFHLRDGFYFCRHDDGTISVEVWRHTSRYHLGSPVEGWYRSEVLLTTVEGIASAMASVSRRGENNQTFGEAVRFLSASTAPEPFGPPGEGAIQRRCWTINAGPDGWVTDQCWLFNGHDGPHQWTVAKAAALDVDRLAACLQRHVELGGQITPMTVRSCMHHARLAAEEAK